MAKNTSATDPKAPAAVTPESKTLGPGLAHVAEVTSDALTQALADLRAITAAKDGAYAERNRLVAALARCAQALGFPVGRGKHEDQPGVAWEPDWRNVIYIRTPEGQVSWHVHDSEMHLFDWMPVVDQPWDGHDSAEKYRRLAAWRPVRRVV